MKRFFVLAVVLGSIAVSTTGCFKKCTNCPAGYYLAVDNPKANECVCCPNGTTYGNDGYCY
jgi:hypothetical protein